MVLGMAGIFGGNAVDKALSAPATATQTTQNTTKKAPAAPSASTFAPVLRDVIHGMTPGQRAAILAKTVATTDGNSSITLIPGLPPVTVPTTPPPATTTPATTTSIPAAPAPTNTAPADSTGGVGQVSSAIDILTAQLRADGMDVSQIQMVEQDQLVTVPGGPSYYNNEIVINVNGRTHSYSADLTSAYPQITSKLIQQFMDGYDV